MIKIKINRITLGHRGTSHEAHVPFSPTLNSQTLYLMLACSLPSLLPLHFATAVEVFFSLSTTARSSLGGSLLCHWLDLVFGYCCGCVLVCLWGGPGFEPHGLNKAWHRPSNLARYTWCLARIPDPWVPPPCGFVTLCCVGCLG